MTDLRPILASYCSNNIDPNNIKLAELHFAQKVNNISKEKFNQIAKDLDILIDCFSYYDCSDKAQFGLINAHYKHNDPIFAPPSYELQIVKHYIKHSTYLSAGCKANYILKNFKKASITLKAITAMVVIYLH